MPPPPWQHVAPALWDDWRWQLRNALRTPDQLAAALGASPADVVGLFDGFEVGVTPHFASLIAAGDPDCPLRRQVVPDAREALRAPFEKADPLGEERHRGGALVHKYPDRVLLLVTDTCAAYCRYCTRSRWVAKHEGDVGASAIDAAIDAIAADNAIRDVLISGGDPLLLSDGRLAAIIDRLSAIPHLRLIRVGTRVPVFLPMRVDAGLVAALRPRGVAVYVNVHINHHRELSPPAVAALARLADAGIQLAGQAVLLRGVNDDAATLRDTFFAMLAARVRPYYLFHCDPVVGTAHLRVPVARGLELMRALIGHTSGMAVPKYVVDLEGEGKVPLWPDYVERVDGETAWIRGYRGVLQAYPVGG